jgi:hypothetical protein
MASFTLEKAISAFTSIPNLLTLFYMILMLVFWYSARYWQTPERIKKRVVFFNPKPTQYLQKKFRHPFLDKFTSVFWFWIFGSAIYLMWFISLFIGAEAWRYGVPIVTAVSTSLFIQIIYPVVVPIRYGDFGKEIPVQLIRFDVMENSDKINGLLYNGLPSNHLGMVVTGIWYCLTIYLTDSWTGWLIIALIFIIAALIFSFTVLYLGEHYWQDLVAAVVVYLTVLTVTKYLIEIIFPLA